MTGIDILLVALFTWSVTPMILAPVILHDKGWQGYELGLAFLLGMIYGWLTVAFAYTCPEDSEWERRRQARIEAEPLLNDG